MLYLAYGSNLLGVRLRASQRVPSAVRVDTVRLDQHCLCFDKRGSRDGSGKCRLKRSTISGDHVWGALVRIDPRQRSALDRVEGVGRGYEVRSLTVCGERLGAVEVFTYWGQAEHVDPTLLPFRWYVDLVVAGAQECGFPATYVESIRRTPAQRDPDRARARVAAALLVRAAANGIRRRGLLRPQP